MTNRRIILIVLLVALLVTGILAGPSRLFGRGSPERSVTLEMDSHLRVTIAWKPRHPFLAEYERRATIDDGVSPLTVELPADPGGSMPMQVALHRDNAAVVLVLTGVDSYCFDLNTRTRTRFAEGKFGIYDPKDPTLPPLVQSFTIHADGSVTSP